MLHRNSVFQKHHKCFISSKIGGGGGTFSFMTKFVPNAAWIPFDLNLHFLVIRLCSWNILSHFLCSQASFGPSQCCRAWFGFLGLICLGSFFFYIYSRQGSNLIQLRSSETCKAPQCTWNSWIALLPLLTSKHIEVWLQYWLRSAYLCSSEYKNACILFVMTMLAKNFYIAKGFNFSLNMAYLIWGTGLKPMPEAAAREFANKTVLSNS